MRVFVTGATGFIGSAIVRGAIGALGSALACSERPMVVTSGTALVAPGRLATEEDMPIPGATSYPGVPEETAASAAARNVRASVMRLAQVHDRVKQGLVIYLIALARKNGVSAFAGNGLNRWPAVHRLDAAHLYRLALEKGSAEARYHAVAEEGVPLREIAEAIGRGLKVPVISKSPEEAARHFGFLGFFVGVDCPASSALTQERPGWRPTSQPGMIEYLDNASAFEA